MNKEAQQLKVKFNIAQHRGNPLQDLKEVNFVLDENFRVQLTERIENIMPFLLLACSK